MAQAEWWGNKDALRTLTWIDNGREKQEAPLAVFRNPQDYTLNLYDIQHRAYAALEMWDEALPLVLDALVLVPDHKSWLSHLRFYEEAQRSDRTAKSLIQPARSEEHTSELQSQ